MKQTQKQIIIEKLNRDGEVDNFWAIHNRVSLRLGAIMHALKKEGWQFTTEMDKSHNYHYKVLGNPQPNLKGVTNLKVKEFLTKDWGDKKVDNLVADNQKPLF